MSAWVPFTVEEFRNDLPVDFLNQHATWVAMNPGKAARMAEIVASTVNRFRQVVRSNPRNVLDADLTTVPATGFDYAFAVAAYTLGLEMGVTGSGAVAGVTTVNVTVPVVSAGGGYSSGTNSSSSSVSSPTGLNFMDAMGRQVVRAEVWLRMVQSGLLLVVGDDPGGTPSYQRPKGRERDRCSNADTEAAEGR